MTSNTALKVVFCTDGIFPHAVGGMQRHSRLLIESLAKLGGLQITVIHPHKGIRVFPDFPEIKEIALDPLPGKRNYLLELYDYSKAVQEQLEKMPDHLVYSQGLSVWKGVGKLGRRTIVNPHGLEPFQGIEFKEKAKTLPYRIIFSRIFKRCNKVVSLGGRLTAILKSAGRPDNVVVLPNATLPLPLPETALIRPPQPPMKFLFVARFAHNKGIDVLLEAAKMLNAAGLQDRYELDLSGKGPLFEQMKAAYPLPNVRFRGFVTDEELDQAYLDDDVFILPTLFEGMPTVVLEAMARAMPVIVTDTGATLELVDDRNGIIIPKQDSRATMQAMRQMIELPEASYLEMSRHSLLKFKERFTWEAVAKAHLNLFREVSQSL